MENLTTSCRAIPAILLLFGAMLTATAQPPGSMPMTDIYGHMGIGTITPDKSAILDLSSTTAGFLMPRLTNAQRNAIVNPATGLMIFNTDTKTIEFNIGTTFAPIWDPVVTASSSGLFWSLTGNAATNPAVNFIGTTDAQPLVVRTSSTERLRVATTGEVGIGTAAPTAGRLLEVAGSAGAANVRLGSASGAANASAWAPTANDGLVTADANGDLLKRSAGAVVGSVAWLKTGNGGAFTDGVDNLMGTTSNAPLNVIVNGARAMRFEPNATSANIIGGFNGNSVTAGAVGATIAGGGANGSTNSVTDDYGVVGGGAANHAGNNAGGTSDAQFATVGGGYDNTASANYSTVGGGYSNSASGDASTVGGGYLNTASGAASTVGGGYNNTDAGDFSAIPGGHGLTLDATAARSFGFHANNSGGTRNMTISTPDVAVFGNADLWLANNDGAASELRFFEAYNTAGAFPNTANYTAFKAQTQGNDITYTLPAANGAAGQVLQIASTPTPTATTATLEWAAGSSGWSLTGNAGTTPGTDFLGTTDNQAFEIHVDNGGVATEGRRRVMRFEPNATSANIIGGFNGNSVTAGAVGATIAGGGATSATNSVTDDYGVVGGGQNNRAGNNTGTATDAPFATVGGGRDNTASNDYSTVGGGEHNTASEAYSTVGGGVDNTASEPFSTVGGGYSNTASGTSSTVGGGYLNTASGTSSTVGGGVTNSAEGDFSTIPGGRGLTLAATARGSFGFLGANAGANNMTISTPDVAVFGNTDLWLANNDGAASELRFFEDYSGAGAFPNGIANYTAFKAQAQGGDITYTLPSGLPAPAGTNQLGAAMMLTDNSGNLSWKQARTTSAALTFALTATGATDDQTITVTGATVGDIVSLGVPNGAVPAGFALYSAWVSAADTVTVRFYNNTGVNQTPTGTFSVMVVKP